MNSVLSAFSPVRNLKQLFVRPEGNFPVLDGFRALSILLVVTYHTFTIYAFTNHDIDRSQLVEQSGLAWAWVWNSDKAVDIFFVISGFLISGILLRQIREEGRIRMGNFYLRRFLRLSPAYWGAMLLYVFFHGPNAHNLWANVLYVNNFLPFDKQAMTWTWSLAIEEQFYLVYPVLLFTLLRFHRNPERWMWGLMGLSFVIRLLVVIVHPQLYTMPASALVTNNDFHVQQFELLYQNLYTRYGALFSGCLAAFYYYNHEAATKRFLNSRLGHILGVLSLVTIVVLMELPIFTHAFDDWYWMNMLYQTAARNLLAGSVAYLALLCVENSYMSRVLNLIFGNRFWHPLAQLSYSMYLLQMAPIVAVVSIWLNTTHKYPNLYHYTQWQTMSLLTLYSTGLTIFLALIFYLLIERPIMNLRK